MRVAEDARPSAKAGLVVAELAEHDEVHAGEIFGEAAWGAGAEAEPDENRF